MRKLRPIAVLIAATSLLMGLAVNPVYAIPAHNTGNEVDVDPTGDVADDDYDIISTELFFNPETIELTVQFDGTISSNLSAPEWATAGRYVFAMFDFGSFGMGSWSISTDGTSASFTPPGETESEECDLTPTFPAADTVTLTAEAECFGRPGAASYIVQSANGDNSLEDNAPDDIDDSFSVQSNDGYWLLGTDGGVFSFGDTKFYGSTGSQTLNAPVVGLSPLPSKLGYRFVAADGGVFSYHASFLGSMGGSKLNAPVVAMATTESGEGYWLVAKDGGVFNYGDAGFFQSMGGKHLNAPIVSIVPTPSEQGYWLIAEDGGVFAFGDADFYGSLVGVNTGTKVVAAALAESGAGLYLLTANGGLFNFGDSDFLGTAANLVNGKATSIDVLPGGYRIVDATGEVFEFGDILQHDDLVTIDLVPNGAITGIAG